MKLLSSYDSFDCRCATSRWGIRNYFPGKCSFKDGVVELKVDIDKDQFAHTGNQEYFNSKNFSQLFERNTKGLKRNETSTHEKRWNILDHAECINTKFSIVSKTWCKYDHVSSQERWIRIKKYFDYFYLDPREVDIKIHFVGFWKRYSIKEREKGIVPILEWRKRWNQR